MIHRLYFYLPGWGWFVALAALVIFYAFGKSQRNRRENNRQRFRDRQAELLRSLKREKDVVNDDNIDSESV